ERGICPAQTRRASNSSPDATSSVRLYTQHIARRIQGNAAGLFAGQRAGRPTLPDDRLVKHAQELLRAVDYCGGVSDVRHRGWITVLQHAVFLRLLQEHVPLAAA